MNDTARPRLGWRSEKWWRNTPWQRARMEVNDTDGGLNNDDGLGFDGWLMVAVMAVEC